MPCTFYRRAALNHKIASYETSMQSFLPDLPVFEKGNSRDYGKHC
nr:hypothetical protein [Desulfurella sp.]